MAKLTNYLFILITIIALFHLAGLIENTPSSVLLGLITNPSSITQSTWYVSLSGILTGLFGLSAIAIGLIAPQRLETIFMVSTGSFLFFLGVDWVAIFNIIKQLNLGAAIIIISPLMIVYYIVVVNWVRGLSN